MDEILHIKNLSKRYGDTNVLKNINISVKKGEVVVIIGPSGCGKSTLLRCLAGLESISSGRILLDGEEITHVPPRQRNVGMIFQQYSLFPTMNVYNNIAFGLKIQGVSKEEARLRIAEALKMADLAGSENKYPSQLSGGEQQRVAIARALANDPPLILADEPTGNLDTASSIEIMELFSELHREGATVVVVTHEEDIASFTHRIIRFRDGQIISDEKNEAWKCREGRKADAD